MSGPKKLLSNVTWVSIIFAPYVIPEIISQLAKSSTVRLGNNSFRDFQYAGDAVRMAVDLLENGEFGEVYNNLGSTLFKQQESI